MHTASHDLPRTVSLMRYFERAGRGGPPGQPMQVDTCGGATTVMRNRSSIKLKASDVNLSGGARHQHQDVARGRCGMRQI